MIRVKIYSGDLLRKELRFDVCDAKEVARTVRDGGAGILRYEDGRAVVHQELAPGNYVFYRPLKRIKIDDMEKLAQQNLPLRFVTLREENSIDQLPWPFTPTAGMASSSSFTLRLLDFSNNRLLKAIWGKRGQMLERPCYKELLGKIKAYVQMFPNDNVPVLLRGSPGIGKTAFLLYVLVELVEDKKKVLFRTKGGVLYYFGYDPEGIYHGYKVRSYDDANLDIDPEIWFLADGRLPDPPVYVGAAILASTPLKTNYKEFEKDAKLKVFLPIWSAREMALLRQEVFPEVGLQQFKELYCQWGGIPRRVLEDPSQDLIEVINGMPSLQELVSAVTLEQADSDHPLHQLLYMRVMEGYGKYDLMFASPRVRDVVYEKLVREQESSFSGFKDKILQSAFERQGV